MRLYDDAAARREVRFVVGGETLGELEKKARQQIEALLGYPQPENAIWVWDMEIVAEPPPFKPAWRAVVTCEIDGLGAVGVTR